MSTPEIAFIIPARNAAPHLRRCLASVEAARGSHDIEVVVVDNGSIDDTARVARASGASVLDSPRARVGALRNEGSRGTRAPVLAFVDADHEIGPGWIDACLESLADRSVGGIGLACDPPTPATWVQRMYDLLRARPRSRIDVRWLGAGNMAVRRDVFDAVGGFDERLEACEDVALSEAIIGAGFRLVAEPRMRSVHHGDPSTLLALFRGELWRGRDNLRVSWRGSWRSKIGALVPLATLVAMALLAAGLVVLPWLGWLPAAAAAGTLLAIASIRASAIVRRGRLWAPWHWLQGMLVALTFEVARGLAVLGGATHATRARARTA